MIKAIPPRTAPRIFESVVILFFDFNLGQIAHKKPTTIILTCAVMRFWWHYVFKCRGAFGRRSNPETFFGVNARPDFSGAQVDWFFVTHLLWFDFRPVLKYFKLFFQLFSGVSTLPFVCNSFWVNLFWKQITQNKSLTLLRTVVVSRNEEKNHRRRATKVA